MIDEKKLREKLAKILEKTAYRGLHTFQHEHLINDVIAAAKDCEEIAEEEDDWIGEEDEE
jgi:hypothetical protein